MAAMLHNGFSKFEHDKDTKQDWILLHEPSLYCSSKLDCRQPALASTGHTNRPTSRGRERARIDPEQTRLSDSLKNLGSNLFDQSAIALSDWRVKYLPTAGVIRMGKGKVVRCDLVLGSLSVPAERDHIGRSMSHPVLCTVISPDFASCPILANRGN